MRRSQVLASTKTRPELVAVMAAFEHARPVHVPAFPDPEAVGDSLAVAVPELPERALATGDEEDALVEGLLASGDPKAADAREEVGSGAKNSRVDES